MKKNLLKSKSGGTILIIIAVLVSKVVSIILNNIFVLTIPDYLNKKSGPDINIDTTEGYIKLVLEGLILSPLLETLVFQHFLLKFVFNGKHTKYAVVVSALLFSLSHFYSVYYIILSFFTGFFFSLAYLIAQKYLLKPSPFYIVVIIHLLYNFISFLVVLCS